MTTRRPIRRAVLALYALVLVTGTVTLGTPAEAAAGDVTITGHGYGHGRGLSQWGSYGYATTYGWNHLQILGHYYSNASLGNIGNPLIGVRLTALDNVPIQITSQADFTVSGWPLSPGTAAEISRNSDGSWQMTTRFGCNGPVGGTTPISNTIANTVADPGNDLQRMLTVCQTGRAYRGALSVAFDGGTRAVNTLYMQDYLRGVVPRESPASWGSAAGGKGLNALMAQAVAARSYAQAENRYSYAKTCDTTACQVYGGAGVNGTTSEDWRTDAAVGNTGGEVMMLGGQVARTEFSSSTGGHTAGGVFPAVRDDGDTAASPYSNWAVTVPGSTISSKYGVGSLQAVTVLSRNGLGADGGRVTKVRISGSSRSVDVNGDDFRSALGLKSDWFTPGPVQGSSGPSRPDISPATVSSVRTGPGSVITFVRGTNGSLYYTTYVHGVFSGFTELPAGTLSGPATVTTDGTHVEVFVVGTDRALWHSGTRVDWAGRPQGFSSWTSLGGSFSSAPTAAASDLGTLTVAARGMDGDYRARTFRAGAGWGAWTSVGGSGISAPGLEVVNWATYRVHVVGTDGLVWSRELSSGSGWPMTDWVSGGLASGFAPGVSSTVWGRTGARALALSNGPGVRQIWADGRLVDIGGAVTSSVSLVEWDDMSLWTFARGGDGALWVNVLWDPSSPSGWFKIGGRLA